MPLSLTKIRKFSTWLENTNISYKPALIYYLQIINSNSIVPIPILPNSNTLIPSVKSLPSRTKEPKQRTSDPRQQTSPHYRDNPHPPKSRPEDQLSIRVSGSYQNLHAEDSDHGLCENNDVMDWLGSEKDGSCSVLWGGFKVELWLEMWGWFVGFGNARFWWVLQGSFGAVVFLGYGV